MVFDDPARRRRLAEPAERFPTLATPSQVTSTPTQPNRGGQSALTDSRDDKKVVTLVGAGERKLEMLTKVITVPRFTARRKAGDRRVINKIGGRQSLKETEKDWETSFRRGLGVLANYMPKEFWVGRVIASRKVMMALQGMDYRTKKCRGSFKRVYFTWKRTMTEQRETKTDVCMCPLVDAREAKRLPKKTKRARTWSCVCNSWDDGD